MRTFLLFLVFFISSFAHAGLSAGDKAYFPYSNIMDNGGFENGLARWTASDGTFSLVTSGTNLLTGRNSVTWDAAADGDTLCYNAVTVSQGLASQNGIFSLNIKVPSGTATHSITVTDGTTTYSEDITSSATALPNKVTFIFPAAGETVTACLEANADEPLIAIDDGFMGNNYIVGDINLPNVYSAKIADDGTVSDESPVNWIEGNCTNADPRVCTYVSGLFTSAPNCTTDGTEEVTSTSSSSVSIDQDTLATTVQCQKTGSDVVTVQSFDQTDRPWTAYTPTIVGHGTTTNVDFFWRRVGENMEIRGYWTAGTRTATEFQIPLPGSYVIDSDSVSPIQRCGTATWSGSTTTSYGILCTAGDSFLNMAAQSTTGLTPKDGDEMGGNSTSFSVEASVPIEGWNATNGVGMVRHSATYGSEGVTKGCRFVLVQSTTHTFTDYDGCVASVGDDGAGASSVNFTDGYWSGNVTCVGNNSDTPAMRVCRHDTPTTSLLDVQCQSADGSANDATYSYHCFGAP